MKLLIERRWPKKGYTIGVLYIDGERFCETLEDTDRHLTQGMTLAKIKSAKVYGQTAIPKGTYGVTLSPSGTFASRTWAQKWKGLLPLILSVPGFEGIRIHPGNYASDTLGCILVGENKVVGGLVNSTATYHRLMQLLTDAVAAGDNITITIR